MGWLETIVLGVVLLAAGLYLLLAVAIVVTAMVERRPLKYLVPAGQDDPEWQKLGSIASGRGAPGFAISDSNPYTAPGSSSFAESQISAAARLGFAASGLFKHSGGGIYKTYDVLMVSPSRAILAVVRWGTTGAIRNEACVLYSVLEDGRYLVTSARPTGARAPGFTTMSCSWVRLRPARRPPRAAATGLQPKCQAILAGESSRAIRIDPREPSTVLDRKRRRVLDRSRADRVPLNPQGALKMYALTFSTKHVDRSLSSATVR